MQFGEALRCCRNFQTADLVEAPLAVKIHACELLDRVSGEARHRFRRVGLEDETRCVRCRTPGQRQRALIQHGNPVPAAGGEFIGQICAHDAGADDDYTRNAHDLPLADAGDAMPTRSA